MAHFTYESDSLDGGGDIVRGGGGFFGRLGGWFGDGVAGLFGLFAARADPIGGHMADPFVDDYVHPNDDAMAAYTQSDDFDEHGRGPF